MVVFSANIRSLVYFLPTDDLPPGAAFGAALAGLDLALPDFLVGLPAGFLTIPEKFTVIGNHR